MAKDYCFILQMHYLAGKCSRFTVCVKKKPTLKVEILGSPTVHYSVSKLRLDHTTSHPRRQYFNVGIFLTFIFSVHIEMIICFVCVCFILISGECFALVRTRL